MSACGPIRNGHCPPFSAFQSGGLGYASYVPGAEASPPDSDNLGQDSIWGLLSDLDPVTQPQLWIAGLPAFAKAYKIVERL